MLRRPSAQGHLVVDMTPLGPAGQNGGAGLVARSLVHHLAALAPDLQFTLLTSAASHAELAALEAPNVARRCVVGQAAARHRGRRLVERALPSALRAHVKAAFHSLRTARRMASLVEGWPMDLLFCPFTAPYFWRKDVPCVSIVYDLQHVSCPEFFSAEQRLNRQRHLADAGARSARVVCISDYVRGTLLANVAVRPERAVTIPLGLLAEPVTADGSVVARLGLTRGAYLLYPANFWPHKNHQRLFEAMRLAHGNVQLVCTGAPNPMMRSLEAVAPANVRFAGYTSPAQLAALFEQCAALIFPSLYEGFGMPVLEAMACGRPVLCSNVAALPEVAGDAALYFDPREPAAIAGAIDRLSDDASLADLVARGRQRVEAFGDGRAMAARYLELIRTLC